MNVAWATSRDQNITEIQFSKDLRPERNHTEYPRIVMANFAALTRSSEKQASPFAVSLRFKDVLGVMQIQCQSNMLLVSYVRTQRDWTASRNHYELLPGIKTSTNPGRMFWNEQIVE